MIGLEERGSLSFRARDAICRLLLIGNRTRAAELNRNEKSRQHRQRLLSLLPHPRLIGAILPEQK